MVAQNNMQYTVPNPFGLDYYVELANSRLYGRLKQVWGVNDSNYNSFGRAQRNKSSDGYIPEYYNAASKGYVSGSGRNNAGGLFFEDSLAVVSFWGLVDPIKRSGNGDSVAKMQVIFFVDTTKITPGAITDAQGQRLDDVCVNDVRNFIQFNGCGFTPGEVYKDIDKVLERYSGGIKKGVLDKNMNKFLAFRVDVEIRYNAALSQSTPVRQLEPMDKLIVLFIKNSPDPTQLIPVGNGKFIYKEYAPTNVLMPILKDTATPYLAYKNVQMLVFNNGPDLLANYNQTAGAWDRTGQGTPYGFNDGDFAGILFTDLT